MSQENNTTIFSFCDCILKNPLALSLLIVFFQGVLGVVLVVSVLPDSEKHGSQFSLSPEDAIVMEGQRVYIQEGCHYCHTQNLRPFAWELKRFTDLEKLGYFPSPNAMEYHFEAPFPKGSRRIGPDLSRLATLQTHSGLSEVLKNKKQHTLKESVHQYGYLFEDNLKSDAHSFSWKIRLLMQMRVPFSDNYQRSASFSEEDISRGEALIQYLLSRGAKQMRFSGKYYRKD